MTLRRTIAAACLILLAAIGLARPALAQDDARALLERAAEAMGGLEQLQALDTVVYTGFGQRAYYQGGGNITGDPRAPMKWQQLTDVQRSMSLWPEDRARMTALYQERWGQEFPFAGLFGLDFQRRNTFQNGADMLDHPLPALLVALDPATALGAVSEEDGLQVLAFTPEGASSSAWIAIDPQTNLPRFTRWISPHANLGDLTTTAWFSGYLPFSGVHLPMGLLQELDWRGATNLMFQIDSYRINSPLQRTSMVPIAGGDAPSPEALVAPLAPGVWDVRVNGAGGPVMEFADRLVMFEAYGGEAQTLARIDAANQLVPDKRVGAVIVSHHHFDHTGGLRAAVSRGLEVISHRGNEGIIRDMANRLAMHYPDALARNPQALQFTPVDDVLVLEDATRRLEIYRVIEHAHMPDAVFAYLPAERLMMEGDLGDEAWQLHWWGSAYRANIAHRGIDPSRNVAVHGTGALTIDETLANTRRQIAAAAEYCATAEAGGRYVMGCPVQYDVDGPVDLAPR